MLLDLMVEDFFVYMIFYLERIFVVVWIVIDCFFSRFGIVVGFVEYFLTFFMGNCFNNYYLLCNLFGCGVENLEY